MSGPTKADLEQRLAEVTAERDRAIAYQPTDAEAAAIARCVKAVEPLVQRRSNQSYPTLTYSGTEEVAIRRVLHYIAKRFGFTLYDEAQPTYEQCPSCEQRGFQ